MCFRREILRSFRLLAPIALLVVFGSAGCGALSRRDKDPDGRKNTEGATQPSGGSRVPLGEISYVDEVSRFVLVRTGRTIGLGPGSPLEARRDDEMVAELTYSPERRTGFMVADIRRGVPMVGDLVMVHGSEVGDEEEARRRQAAQAQENTLKASPPAKGRNRGGKKR